MTPGFTSHQLILLSCTHGLGLYGDQTGQPRQTRRDTEVVDESRIIERGSERAEGGGEGKR